MAKAVILKTNEGVKLIGSWQCSNGAFWNAEGCFRYCNGQESDFWNEHQMRKLLYEATTLGFRPKAGADWFKHRENFIDIEIPYEDVDQGWDQGYVDEIVKRGERKS